MVASMVDVTIPDGLTTEGQWNPPADIRASGAVNYRLVCTAFLWRLGGGREGVRSPVVSPPVVLRLWRWLRHVVPVRRRVGGRSRA